MDLLGGDNLDLGVSVLDVGTSADGTPTVAADPRKEYTAAGEPFLSTWDYIEREGVGCGPLGWHGLDRYQRMYNTPAVGSSFNALRAAVLSGPVGLLPAVRQRNGPPAEGQVDGSAVEGEMAAEIADSNRRTLDAWETPANLVAWEGMEAMYLGHMLAERVVADVEDGPDAGLLAIRKVRWLPRSSYRFRVDRSMNVIGINALTVKGDGSLGWDLMEPEHFTWLTWDPYRGDPRGRSLFRMAYHAWRMLMRLWPEIEKGWHQFGTPYLWGTTAPNARHLPPTDPATGRPMPGAAPISPEQAMVIAMNRMVNGSRAAGPNGSDLKVIESSKDSTMVSNAIGLLEGQVIRAILLQLRATVEAKHGSKADGEIGQDIMGTLVRFVRIWLERWLRSLLMGQNALNYGQDIARRLTPLVTLGEQEHQDFAAVASGVGLLWQSGFFAKGQMPFVDTFIGFPQRDPDDARVGPQGVIPDTPPADPNAPTDPEADPAEGPQAQGVAA